MMNLQSPVKFKTHSRSTPSKTYYSFFLHSLLPFSPSPLYAPFSLSPFPLLLFPILSLREIPGGGGAAELRERGRQSSGDLPWAAWARHGAAAGSPIVDPSGAPALRPHPPSPP